MMWELHYYSLGKVDRPLSTAYTGTSQRYGSKEYFATVFHNKKFLLLASYRINGN